MPDKKPNCVTSAGSDAVCGTVGQDGRLLSADARLLALQVGAGGSADGMLAVPQLASLARLARTLGVVVSRGVIAADGDVDLDLWVRAAPEGEVVRLAIAGWAERPRDPANSAMETVRRLAVAQMANDGLWTTDAQLGLVALDAVLASQIEGSWRGIRLTKILHLQPLANGELPLLDAILDGTEFAGQVAVLAGSSNAELTLYGTPSRDKNGAVTGYSGGFRWIGEASATFQRDEPAGGDDPHFVEKLDQALRQPIGQIIADADAIGAQQHGSLKEDYAGYAADIASAGRHLLGLVDDLSDLQAAERLDFKLDLDRIDLGDVARRTASLLGVRAADSRVQIDSPEADEQLLARADFRRTLQIMVNIVGNAIRYSPEDSMIWIRAEQEDDIVALIVADQGKGIAYPDQERIFEKFERVDPTEPGGSGLGLYISRKLARAMGGDLTVDSAPGLGARFVLTLPAA